MTAKSRTANAVWQGGLKDGNGNLSTESGALKQVPYGFSNRFEDEPGTNPEELVAAAHAGCFSMALSAGLEKAGTPATSIATEATVSFEKQEPGWRITAIHLDVEAEVPGVDEADFSEAAEGAKTGCPISNALNPDIEVTLDARLSG